ncbi:hypothetical protein GTA08_BOTSDO13298 [Botryosphaeria dothidea]|uniref:Uncharacterized protein n=1 Tax=Botryosphaeria dothidea TaxID=55169 RepID=A0A8H4J170_9PEZI|nr:hypothetical protein GTA08_BOTSDO13298 [Botryosphaeria dothidea]
MAACLARSWLLDAASRVFAAARHLSTVARARPSDGICSQCFAPVAPHPPPIRASTINHMVAHSMPSSELDRMLTRRSLSPPPDYNTFDPLARDFHLDNDLIYASNSNLPQYQIKLTPTTTGRPHKLRLRRLLPTETRRAAHRQSTSSVPSAQPTVHPLTRTTTAPPSSSPLPQPASTVTTIPYDADMTCYTATLHPTNALKIRGHRASSLRSYITVAPSPLASSAVARTTSFHHHVRNEQFDALDPAHDARIQKYGYHSKDEWVREVLFKARGGGGRKFWVWKGKGCGRGVVEWVDGQGIVCAVGSEEGGVGEEPVVRRLRLEAGAKVMAERLRLEEGGAKAVPERRVRDVLVMCWMVRLWGALAGISGRVG